MAEPDDSQLVSGYRMVPVRPSASPFRHRIGGPACDAAPLCTVCDRALAAYVLLDLSDPRLGIEADRRFFPVLYCHNCETVADLFAYRIAPNGSIQILRQRRGRVLGNWPLPRGDHGIELAPVPDRLNEILLRCPKGWYFHDYETRRARPGAPAAGAADIDFMEEFVAGRRTRHGMEGFHQLGGLPLWLQRPQPVTCPRCAQPMPFLLSLGSDERLNWQFGDWGRLYVFLCSPCSVVAALIQFG
jgi:hypothetical protein